jgi:anti-anti-sigma factor
MELQRVLKKEKPIQRQHTVKAVGDWHVFAVVGRVDAFNFAEVKAKLDDLAQKHPHHLAISLEEADFLCIPFIKLLAQIAEGLKTHGARLALVAPTEKLKRQIDIFASLDEMIVFRSIQNLD